MQLTYANAASTMIQAVLNAGEGLATFAGPVTTIIPVSGSNSDYQAIAAKGLTINPYIAPSAPTPEHISRRQFFHQLALPLPWAPAGAATITQADALAAVGQGVIPAPLLALISGLAAADQFGAKMTITGDADFKRHHGLVLALGQAFGWTPPEIDQFWEAAATL